MMKILFTIIIYTGITLSLRAQGIQDSLREKPDKVDSVLQKTDTYINKATPNVSGYIHGKISKADDSLTKTKNKPARHVRDSMAMMKKQAKASKAFRKAQRAKAKIDRKSRKVKEWASKAGGDKILSNKAPSLNSKAGDKINLDKPVNSLTKPIHESADKGLSKAAQPLPVKDLQNARQQAGEVQGAARQLNALRKGNADSLADQAILKSNALKTLPKDMQTKLSGGEIATASAEQLSALKTQAFNHFAGKEEAVMAVVTSLSEKRSKVLNNGGLMDMLDKKINSQKSLPWYQRTFAGITLQLQKRDSWQLDLNPFLTYSLTNRWQVGAGWNERIAYNFERKKWAPEDRAYGPRSEVCFLLNSYAALCGQVELMNARHRTNYTRQWTWGCFAGLRTHIQLPKKWALYAYLLFQIKSNPDYNPYAFPVAVRIAVVREGLKKK